MILDIEKAWRNQFWGVVPFEWKCGIGEMRNLLKRSRQTRCSKRMASTESMRCTIGIVSQGNLSVVINQRMIISALLSGGKSLADVIELYNRVDVPIRGVSLFIRIEHAYCSNNHRCLVVVRRKD